MALFFLDFIFKQLFYRAPYPTQDLTGRTYIITGGNTGLGKEAARHLVRLNAAKVIITSRDSAKGAAAKADIESTTGRKGVLDVWELDLQNYDSIRAFAKRVEALDRVDGILENAAKATGKYELVNGHESTITVNVIATLYMALLVLPKLKEVANKYDIVPVLSTVSSEVHFMTPFNERKAENILSVIDQNSENMMERYPLSKILQVYGSREIARREPLQQGHVIINFLNPGLCRSELARELDTFAWHLQTFLLARTTEMGARFLVHGLVSAGPESHGKYLDCCQVKPCAPLVEGPEGPELQARVWKELSTELEKIQPGILKNLDA